MNHFESRIESREVFAEMIILQLYQSLVAFTASWAVILAVMVTLARKEVFVSSSQRLQRFGQIKRPQSFTKTFSSRKLMFRFAVKVSQQQQQQQRQQQPSTNVNSTTRHKSNASPAVQGLNHIASYILHFKVCICPCRLKVRANLLNLKRSLDIIPGR